MMKTLRALALLCVTLLTHAQSVNTTQHLALAGLRAAAGQGSFPSAAFAADGSLFLLDNQGDGVRVLKLNAAGDTLLAQAHLGAAGDAPLAMALDPSGSVYVTGTSTSGMLSGTSGAAFATRADTSTNSFLAKFDPSLHALFVTFLGAGRTAAASVAATADAVFVTGITFNPAFPVTPDGIQQSPANGSAENGFVERFSANGTILVYATYLTGAGGTTNPNAIAADASDNAYIAGSTSASGFPAVAALIPRIGGTSSGFLTKLTPAGDGIVFSTFVPGNGLTGLALDASIPALLLSGNVSPGQFPIAAAGMPVTSTSYQSLLKLALDGQSLLASTLLVPGTQSFVAPGANGSAWVTGSLTTPLFPGSSQPLALVGDSFALHVNGAGVIDQTARLGGLTAGVFSAGTLTSVAGPPAVSADAATIALPATLTATTDSSRASATRFDLPLSQAPNAALPASLRDLAASCAGSGQCYTNAGYLTLLSPSDGAGLSLSADNLPNLLVRNQGSSTATGLVLTATGYTLSSNCGPTLPPSGVCAVALTGSGPGTLTVSSANAAAQTTVLPANSLAADPLAVLPVELDFGIQTASSPAATRTLTVTNLSASQQSFASTFDSLARTLPYAFQEASSDCATNGNGLKVLPSGASCHITLAFTVSSSATGDADVRGAWKVGAHDIALTGFEQLAALNVSASVIDFGTYFVNGVRLQRYLYVSNNSSSAIAHTPVALPASSAFTLLDGCPTTLEAHSVCRLTLNYSPASAPSVDSVTLTLDQALSVLVTGQTLPQQGTSGTSANPNVAISPTAITFASPVVVSGVSGVTQTVVVRNTGATAVPLLVSVTGDFSFQNGCPSTLAGGSSCQLLVSFAPSQPGSRQGLLSITAGGGSAPAYVNLSGTATSILPANNGILDVGQALAGEPVVAWFKVQQALPSLGVTSSSAAFGVALVEDTGSGHGTLPASAFASSATGSCRNCYLGVQFLAQTPGAQAATLSFATTTAGNPYVVSLIGTALPATGLVLTPSSQDFGAVAVNSSSAPKLFALANLTTPPATANLLTVTASGDFSVAANSSGGASCAGPLSPGATCFVQVIFAPSATGTRTGTLTIATSSGTVTAALSGFGESDPGLALNPVELDFNSVPGTSSLQQSVVVSNTGSLPLAVGQVASSDASFMPTSTCTTLAPGTTCTVTVTFMPGFAQTTGTLSVPATSTVNGQTSTTIYTVALAGLYTTQNAGLEIVPGQVNFGSGGVGSLGLVRQFTLNNLTSKNLAIALSLPRQFPLAGPGGCGDLTAYGSCTFAVTFLPSVAGSATGTVFAQATPTDGSAATQALTYLQGYATGVASLAITGNLIPNSPLMFGQVNSGQTTQQTLTLTNSGSSPLTIRRVVSGPPFLATTSCGATLAAAQSCTVTLTYAPTNEVAAGTGTTAARADTGTLTIESDAATSPNVLQLAGSAAAVTSTSPANSAALATFSLSEGSLTFANTSPGNASAPQTSTLTNTGNVPLHVLTSTISADFTAISDCGTLLPGASCAYTVTFTPTLATSAAVRPGTLEIRTDANTSLEFVTLLESSSAAPLSVTPAALDFGTLNVGTSSALNVSVTNTSQAPVIFNMLSATGDYSVARGSCPAKGDSLAAGATCALQVTFAPTVAGIRAGTLSLATSATTLPLTVSLTGNAVMARLQVTPGALAFGTIAVGAPANLSLNLLNTGSASVGGIVATIIGANASDFAVTVPCSTTTLAPNQGCTVTVTFTPASTGARSASLVLASSDPASPAIFPLTGYGSPAGSFTLIVDGGSSATRTVTSGTPAIYTLTLTPVNGFAGNVALTCAAVTPGLYASCALDPSTVALSGGAQTSTVTINTITSVSAAVRTTATVALAWLWLPILWMRRKRGLPPRAIAVLTVPPLVGLLLGALMSGCGGGNSGNGLLRYTPSGAYLYTVTASSTNGTLVTQTVTLNLKVQ